MSYHSQQKKQDLNERCADVKNKARFDEVVVALDLVCDGPAADCPKCKGVACLHACHDGQGFYCETCNETGDMINLVCLARNLGVPRAVAELEDMLTAKRDDRTGDLFSDSSVKTSAAGPPASPSGRSGRPAPERAQISDSPPSRTGGLASRAGAARSDGRSS